MTAREPPVKYDTRIAPLRSSSRNSTNIRNPLIYYVNRYFLMLGGSQGKADIRNPLCYLLMNAVASRSAFKSLIMQA